MDDDNLHELNVNFYTLKPLVDRKFKISDDPYKDIFKLYEQSDDPLRKEMLDLGILFWRDEEHTNGIVLEPLPQFPVNCFLHQLIMYEEIMTVGEWEPYNDGYVQRHGDNLSWILFNHPIVLVGFDPSRNPMRQ